MGDVVRGNFGFQPTRDAGLARLHEFAPRAGPVYASERNHDFGPQDRSNVSALSPWIRHRLVHERETAAAALEHFAYPKAEKFIQEVLWRTYWKGWLELRPSIWTRFVTRRDEALDTLDRDAALNADYRAAIEGRTGIDCFDSWAKELLQTGYLHNHARMWFASIWIFTLNLPWTLGADFFLRHLMDGDPTSNTLSWRWVAGLQTRGKAYAATAANIAKFTEGRFQPAGLNETPQALTDEPFPEPLPLARPGSLPENQPVFVLIGDDDCCPEALDFGSNDVIAAATWNTIDARSPLAVGDQSGRFTAGALADAAARFGKAHGISVAHCDNSATVADLVRASGARCVLISQPPTGPNRAQLDALKSLLAVETVELRHPWDQRAWPHATKGFFAFRENIPQLLQGAGLEAPTKR